MKTSTFLIAVFFLVFIWQNSFAQRNCLSTVNLPEMQTADPTRYQRFIELENFISNYKANINSIPTARLSNNNGVIVIPVVVHVLHNGEAIGTGLNISDAQINSQIAILNQDFRRLNADRINTPQAFVGIASDPVIEFRLACTDPDGNLTSGVTRTQTTIAAFNPRPNGFIDEQAGRIKFTSLGGRDSWPTNRYLNIWVCNLVGTLLGYAQFPADYPARPNTDGVVCSAFTFGNQGLVNQQLNNPFWNNGTNPFNTGRTATHEIGHWLDLRHIWGDANCGNDFCNDTPIQATSSNGCPAFPIQSCNNGPNGNMFMNYMDYSDDACMNLFTTDQRIRMRAVFAQGGPRAAFVNNYFSVNALSAPICTTASVSVTNPLCLPVTWSATGPVSIISGQGTNTVTVQRIGTQSGTAQITATAGNYTDTYTVSVGTATVTGFNLIGSRFNFGSQTSFFSICPEDYLTYWPITAFTGDITGYEWQVAGDPPRFLTSLAGPSLGLQPNAQHYTAHVIRLRLHTACGPGPWFESYDNVMNCAAGEEPFRTPAVKQTLAYPNPASDELNVQFTKLSDEREAVLPSQIVLYNQQMQVARQSDVKKELKSEPACDCQKIQIDTKGLKKGTYFLQVIYPDGKKETNQIVLE